VVMKVHLTKTERQALGLGSRRWKNLTAGERDMVDVYRQHRHLRHENLQIELRHRLEFEVSRHRVLASMGRIEYQDPPAAPQNRTMMLRFPQFKGTEFQFNQNGHPTEYPFFEDEGWQEVRFEDDNQFFRHSDDMSWLMGWSPMSLGMGGQFPREMMPGSLSSIRVMTGLDLLRFQSKVMYETISPYNGVINHLCNYVCGDKGATVMASSKKDKKLARRISDYLGQWCVRIGFINKIRNCCNDLLRQGECFPRRWRDGKVTLTDPSWCRGPHNEIGQNPWSYGILSPNWPFEIDTVGAYHIWYPSNEHETLSPREQFHARLDSSVGPSAKRSVPLSYRIRPLLPMLESIITEMGQGEVKRQRIAAVISTSAGTDKVKFTKPGIDSPFHASLMDVTAHEDRMPAGMYNAESGFWQFPKPIEVATPPDGRNAAESGCKAYDKVATVAANAIGVASWMMGSDFQEASRATSLTAAEPTVKTGKNIQRLLCEVWEDIAEAQAIYGLDADFPADIFKDGTVKIHIELPNVEVRDMKELYDRLSKQMRDHLKSPQHVASEMGDDFEEEQELYQIAVAEGWKASSSESSSEPDGAKGTTSSGLPTAARELKIATND